MEQFSTHSKSEKDFQKLPYSPERDELIGVEEYNDVFNLLDQGVHSVNEKVVHSVLNFASTYPESGR
jgi:hypothetical protein